MKMSTTRIVRLPGAGEWIGRKEPEFTSCPESGLTVELYDGSRYIEIREASLKLDDLVEFDACATKPRLRILGFTEAWARLRCTPGGVAAWNAIELSSLGQRAKFNARADLIEALAFPQWRAKWAVHVEPK